VAKNITATMAASGQFIPEVWSKEIIVARENNLVLANLVDRYDSDVANKGDVIQVRVTKNLAICWNTLRALFPN
jgi:hypothetical protein